MRTDHPGGSGLITMLLVERQPRMHSNEAQFTPKDTYTRRPVRATSEGGSRSSASYISVTAQGPLAPILSSLSPAQRKRSFRPREWGGLPVAAQPVTTSAAAVAAP